MDIREAIEAFDIKQYLDDRGIDYREHGKNVTRGWVNVQCVFCSDHSNHLGINIRTKQMNCWKCGHHRLLDFIQEAEDISYGRAKSILSQFGGILVSDTEGNDAPPPSGASPLRRRILPPKCSRDFPSLHIEYLRSRGFNPRRIISRFNLRATNHLGPYKFRIIAPFYHQSRIVAFTGLDVTDRQTPKYKNSELEKSIVDPKRMLYNLQNIRRGGSLGIVEGITDAWRIEENVTATMGIKWTQEQLVLLHKLNIKRLFLIYDGESEAMAQAYKLAREAAAFVPSVEVVELPEGKDPCDLDRSDISRLRKWLNEK